MPKEKNFNPVQAAKKAEKAKTLKKQKAQLQTQRTEKLARRNPARIQRDIDALKEAEQTGALRPHERTRLNELEKDLAAVNKARAALGDKAPQFKPERDQRDQRDGGGGRGGRGGVLGKRSRDGGRKGNADDSSDTDADVRRIPMPRDTPPPIPKRYGGDAPAEEKKPTLVYEAAPQVRDFKKEVTSRFMPAAVAQKLKLAKGEGRLLEPDEFDKLQQEGYMNTAKEGEDKAETTEAKAEGEADPELEQFLRTQEIRNAAEGAAEAAVHEAEYEMMAAENQGEIKNLEGESRVAENKLRHVEIEEVEDEGDY
ncbi:uncharacterized protein CC84DRAFT_1241935 [Paraphaeosphaeria sporulosa]|uniref:Wbp11/ELF5/Saf1 N-terminal domain-containing protein n=1 Tax=Paraphaeosphaeria sporulosa TaxID=1460663 RepID=A0A177CJ37_9PLEO|nr:uncharacterized protein CC84DRAFT_1241935 [Paraphaeosphaeria sporulosa]OAG06992.1 hypothetical protein CC84DRAFT_1241935 [Paraphaeosphaeria sporulosa]